MFAGIPDYDVKRAGSHMLAEKHANAYVVQIALRFNLNITIFDIIWLWDVNLLPSKLSVERFHDSLSATTFFRYRESVNDWRLFCFRHIEKCTNVARDWHYKDSRRCRRNGQSRIFESDYFRAEMHILRTNIS